MKEMKFTFIIQPIRREANEENFARRESQDGHHILYTVSLSTLESQSNTMKVSEWMRTRDCLCLLKLFGGHSELHQPDEPAERALFEAVKLQSVPPKSKDQISGRSDIGIRSSSTCASK